MKVGPRRRRKWMINNFCECLHLSVFRKAFACVALISWLQRTDLILVTIHVEIQTITKESQFLTSLCAFIICLLWNKVTILYFRHIYFLMFVVAVLQYNISNPSGVACSLKYTYHKLCFTRPKRKCAQKKLFGTEASANKAMWQSFTYDKVEVMMLITYISK